MKKIFLLLSFCFPALGALAQGWNWADQWTASPNITIGEISLIATDKEGNVFSGGSIGNATTGSLAGVVTRFGSLSLVDSVNASQGFVVKANSAGSYMWALGTQHAHGDIAGMATDTFGNLYVLGFYDSSNCTFGGYPLAHGALPANVYDISFMAKIGPWGNVIWAKNLAAGVSGIFIKLDGVGNVYVAGYFNQHTETMGAATLHKIDTTSIYPDAFIAGFDTAGNGLWAKNFGGAGSTEVTGLAVAETGNLFLTGIYYYASQLVIGADTVRNSGTTGNYIAMFSPLGTPRWARCPDTLVTLNGIAVDTANNIYVTGSFVSSTVNFGSGPVTGSSNYNNLFLVKFDSAGVCHWSDVAKGDTALAGYGVAADKCGNLFLTGGFGSYIPVHTLSFDGTSVAIPSSDLMDYDLLFVARYDNSGSFVNCDFVTGGGDDYCGITVDNYGDYLLGGDWVKGPFVFGSDTLQTSTGSEYFFMAKYFYDTGHCLPAAPPPVPLTSPETPSAASEISIYPNPASGSCTIEILNSTGQNYKAVICDLTGRILTACQLTGNITNIPLTGYAPGMYLCSIYDADKLVTTKKLIIVP